MTNPPPRSSSNLLWMAVVPIVLLSLAAWWFMRGSHEEEEVFGGDRSAFDLAEAPELDDGKAKTYTSEFEKRLEARMHPGEQGPGLAGFVPEGGKMYRAPSGKRGMSEREKEKAFLKKYGRAIRSEERRLTVIGRKYRKSHKIVKEVDLAFGRLPRYMKLKRQYHKDGDVYKWARGTIALPEVRKTIKKYSLNPKVWNVAFQMTSEGLKKKPPKPVYDEAVRFFTEDKQMKDFVSNTTESILPNMGRMMTQAVPPGFNMGPIQSLASDLAPGKYKSELGDEKKKKRRKRTSQRKR